MTFAGLISAFDAAGIDLRDIRNGPGGLCFGVRPARLSRSPCCTPTGIRRGTGSSRHFSIQTTQAFCSRSACSCMRDGLSSGERVPIWRAAILLTALLLTLSRSSFAALGVGLIGGAALIRGVSARMLKVVGILRTARDTSGPAIDHLRRGVQQAFRGCISSPAVHRLEQGTARLRRLESDCWRGVSTRMGTWGRFYGFDATGTSAFALDGGLLFIAVMTRRGRADAYMWRCLGS